MSEYIKREDATDAFSQMYPSATKSFILEKLSSIPAADVEPVVRGEWFLLDDCANAGVYCSACKRAVFKESAWYKNVHIKSKYCPNCGARMIERSGSGE